MIECEDVRETFATCPACCGEGSVERCWLESYSHRQDPHYAVVMMCDDCNGSGWIVGEPQPITQDEFHAWSAS